MDKMTKKKYLLQLAEENGGMLTPEVVVDAARPEDSFLHKSFEWEDDKAGQEYRLWQARQMIKFEVTFIKRRKTRLFRNVMVTMTGGKQQQGYVTVNAILDDEGLYKQTLIKAVNGLKYWKEEYRTLKELEGIINEDKLKEVEKQL